MIGHLQIKTVELSNLLESKSEDLPCLTCGTEQSTDLANFKRRLEQIKAQSSKNWLPLLYGCIDQLKNDCFYISMDSSYLISIGFCDVHFMFA